MQVLEASGEDLFHARNLCIEGIGRKLKDCVGYGIDGPSGMVAEHNFCVKVKCICHLLVLCTVHLFDTLPKARKYQGM